MSTRLSRHGTILGAAVALGVVLALSSSGPALAGPPEITPSYPKCVPSGGNVPVAVSLQPGVGWASVRTYFRANGKPDWYFLEMRAAGQGKFFTTLPMPLSETKGVDLHVEVRDAENQLTRSADVTANVNSSCEVTLSQEEKKVAQNLVVGETIEGQKDKEVLGFRCEGVVSRIDPRGALRPDEACRKILVVAATKKAVLIPALIVGAGGAAIILTDDKPETSPSR